MMELGQLTNKWLENFEQPLIIAGPCSAESESQMLETAERIKNSSGTKIPIFRAGIWKPRTKPNGFEGVGAIGLNWLKKVKEDYGFITATEVANAHHVQAALEADVDILWIGARSTVNPFTVQEIAEALKDTEKIIMVKNPVNPDLPLWIGALERLVGQGIYNLGVIHRGFSTYQKSKYRNNPNWQIALDFKHQYPNVPIFIDPSHITGRRDLLQEVAQEGMNLGYNGIMIETHCNPDNAWSDAAQQVTPEVLETILSSLRLRRSDASHIMGLDRYRTLISDLDFQLIELLAQRMKICEKIGKLKKENNIAIFQPDRWQEIHNYALVKAKETGMSPEFIEKVFKAIHEESIEVQNKM